MFFSASLLVAEAKGNKNRTELRSFKIQNPQLTTLFASLHQLFIHL
jgi:hypothetical protein